MARRLPHPDRATDAVVEVEIDGQRVRARAGEPLAVAAWAAGVRVLSRSLKYHRPRGAFCLAGHCGGCLMRVDGESSVRTCLAPCVEGRVAEAQNAFPSAATDVFGIVDRVFPKKLDHHTLMTQAGPLNAAANRVVRQLSGLGRLPTSAVEASRCETITVDACVVGGGAAGLAAARVLGEAGASVLLVDDQAALGGSLRTDPRHGPPIAAAAVAAARAAGVDLRVGATAIGFFPEDDGGVLAVATAKGLLRVQARAWVWSTGGYASNLPLPDNDRPHVLAARAVGRLLCDHAVLAGDAIALIVEAHPVVRADAAALAEALSAAGARVQTLAADEVEGIDDDGVTLRDGGRVDAEVVAIAAVPSPASEGARQHGCAAPWDGARGGFAIRVDGDGRTEVPGVWACGDVTGYLGATMARMHGEHVGRAAAASLARRA